MIRSDIPYVDTDRTLTQAGYEVFRGQERRIDTLEAADAVEAANAPGSAPRYACRAWVNFNGTGVVAIRAAGNVSSITDNGTGDYTVNFATAMPDADYALVGINTIAADGTKGSVGLAGGYSSAAVLKTTTQVRIRTGSTLALTLADFENISVAVFR